MPKNSGLQEQNKEVASARNIKIDRVRMLSAVLFWLFFSPPLVTDLQLSSVAFFVILTSATLQMLPCSSPYLFSFTPSQKHHHHTVIPSTRRINIGFFILL